MFRSKVPFNTLAWEYGIIYGITVGDMIDKTTYEHE